MKLRFKQSALPCLACHQIVKGALSPAQVVNANWSLQVLEESLAFLGVFIVSSKLTNKP